MKRRVKRRLFLMSVALASGAGGSAFAKEIALPHYDAHARAADAYRPSVADVGHQVRADDSKPWILFSSLRKRIPGVLHAGADAHAGSRDAKGWRLQMMQPETAFAQDQDARLNQGMRLGLALRAAF
jgi:hypothetical protein